MCLHKGWNVHVCYYFRFMHWALNLSLKCSHVNQAVCITAHFTQKHMQTRSSANERRKHKWCFMFISALQSGTTEKKKDKGSQQEEEMINYTWNQTLWTLNSGLQIRNRWRFYDRNETVAACGLWCCCRGRGRTWAASIFMPHQLLIKVTWDLIPETWDLIPKT